MNSRKHRDTSHFHSIEKPCQQNGLNRTYQDLYGSKCQEPAAKKTSNNDTLNYSFQNDSMAHIEQNTGKLTHLESLIDKLITLQIANQEAHQQLSQRMNAIDKKVDRLCHLLQSQRDKENIEPNLSRQVRSGSGIHTSSKIKSFFQEQESVLGRLDSKKTNKSLMSIEERKRLIDREIEKRLKGDTDKRKKDNTVQKFY